MTDGRAARSDATRTAILDAAMSRFASAGFHGTSLREIAAACDMTHAGLVYHFPTKGDLLLAVLARREQVECEAYPVAGTTGREALRSVVASARHNATQRGIVELFATLSAEATAPGHPAHDFFVRRYRDAVAEMVEAFEDLSRRGELRPGVTPELAARTVIAAQDGLQVQWLLDEHGTDMPGALARLIDSMLLEPLVDD